MVFEHIRATFCCCLRRRRAAERTLLHSRSCSSSAFSLFLSRSSEAHPVPPSCRQAPSPLPQTRINSCTQIPLKILSPGCHLFSRGLDQIRPRAAWKKKRKKKGGTSVWMRGLENTTMHGATVLLKPVWALLTHVGWGGKIKGPGTKELFYPRFQG